MSGIATALAVALLSGGCGDGSPPGFEDGNDTISEGGGSAGAARVYERRIVFMTEGPDSLIVVPWFFTARTEPDAVVREVRGWLGRNGTWESFINDRWRADPVRAPWRPLPRGPLRLVVGPGDALDQVIYIEGARHLEVAFGSLLADWTATTGRVYRVHEGVALVSSGEAEGVILDVSRSRAPEPLAGEWGLVLSGDSLQMVIDGLRPVGARGAPGDSTAAAWARLDFRRLQWPEIFLAPDETRAYERARRDVPVSWRIHAADGSVEGRLVARTMEIEAGTGSGALLPVYALFEVGGDVTIEGRPYPVRGVLRHLQP